MTDLKSLKMIPCPKCGKPFPEGRKKLGYPFCVNCTPQNYLRPVIEDQGEGEDTYTVVHIVSQQEYNAIQRGQKMLHGGLSVNPEMEDAPDTSTFEEQDEAMQQFSPQEREARLKAMENDQQGLSERTLEELEQAVPTMEDSYTEDNFDA